MPDVIPGQLLEEDTPQDRNAGGKAWKTRRRLMFAIVAFCMASISWALWKDSDTAVMQTAVTAAFGTISMTLGSYVFGAVWQDTR